MSELTAHGSADFNPTEGEVDDSRRKFLLRATIGMGAVGAAFTATPFVESWLPSERARALGGPTQVDLTKIEAGQMIITIWRRQPIYVIHRTPAMMAQLGNSRRCAQGFQVGGLRPAGVRQECHAFAQRRVPGAAGHLHPPGLPAQAALRCRRCAAGGHLAGRLAVSLPRFTLRPGRPGVQRLAGLGQPGRTALFLSRPPGNCSSARMAAPALRPSGASPTARRSARHSAPRP